MIKQETNDSGNVKSQPRKSSTYSLPHADDFVAHINVRWADIDAYNHINNAKMVSLLEDARLALIRKSFELKNMAKMGIVVADITIKYRAQLTLEDSPLQIVLWVSQIRSCDFVFEYRVYPPGVDFTAKPAIIAQTRMVAFDIANQRIRRLSDEENEFLKKMFHE